MGELLVCFITVVSYNFVVFLLLRTLVSRKVLTIHNSQIFIDKNLS